MIKLLLTIVYLLINSLISDEEIPIILRLQAKKNCVTIIKDPF